MPPGATLEVLLAKCLPPLGRATERAGRPAESISPQNTSPAKHNTLNNQLPLSVHQLFLATPFQTAQTGWDMVATGTIPINLPGFMAEITGTHSDLTGIIHELPLLMSEGLPQGR